MKSYLELTFQCGSRWNNIQIALLLICAIISVNGLRVLSAKNMHAKKFNVIPKPYSFNYRMQLDKGAGHIARNEEADGRGEIQETYSLYSGEEHFGSIHNMEDENEFRAAIRPGTLFKKNVYKGQKVSTEKP